MLHLTETSEGVLVPVLAKPGAKANKIVGVHNGRVRVAVSAAPEKGKANDAIAAVLNPPHTNYVFFVADGKGGHLFAETYAEHQRNVAAYRAYERGEIAREREN